MMGKDTVLYNYFPRNLSHMLQQKLQNVLIPQKNPHYSLFHCSGTLTCMYLTIHQHNVLGTVGNYILIIWIPSVYACLSLLLSSKLMDIKKLLLLLMLDKFVVFSRHTRVLDLAPRVFEYPKWWARECEWSQIDNMMAYFCPPPVHLNMKHDYGNRRLFMSTCEIDRMST